ncbi:MAG: hypothetical protein GY906_37710 [bacterium]|nr:hypothetical protein [bacterium]
MLDRIGFFVSDLHGHSDRYDKLFSAIAEERPGAVFLGGDLFPHGYAFGFGHGDRENFLLSCVRDGFDRLRSLLGNAYPRVYAILGNDDGRSLEADFIEAGEDGELWEYVHNREALWKERSVSGYAFVPPTPFQLKDWERYDMGRYVDPGCVSPEEGMRTVAVDVSQERERTMAKDLTKLSAEQEMEGSIWLFHSPPYKTVLDRAGLDGQMIDHVPLDVHVGSVAIRRFIEERQPAVSLHGHVHESTQRTGEWCEVMGKTHAFNAAHHASELAIVKFDPDDPATAVRELI